jgi:hypothetical protein
LNAYIIPVKGLHNLLVSKTLAGLHFWQTATKNPVALLQKPVFCNKATGFWLALKAPKGRQYRNAGYSPALNGPNWFKA